MRILNRIIIILVFVSSPCFAALDKWGGDDRITSPTSKYETGDATSVGDWTLTKTGAGWGVNEFAGYILQPDTSVESYFLIKSNTSDTLTVYGSDVDDDPEECHRHISDENNGTEEFAILNRWYAEKINNRWWMINPYGHVTWIKALNQYVPHANASPSPYNTDIGGTTLAAALDSHPTYGGEGTDIVGNAGNMFKLIDYIKGTLGFNSLGELNDWTYMLPGSKQTVDEKTSDRYMNFVIFPRIHNLTFDNTDTFTWNDITAEDALDSDFQTDLEDAIENCEGDSASAYSPYQLFDVGCMAPGTRLGSYQAHYLQQYEHAKYGLPANPYFFGVKWDEEPAYVQQEYTNDHLGYRIVTSAGATERKKFAREYLDSAYNDATENLTGIYANIGALNTAWGTSYADWDEFMAEDGTDELDAVLSFEPNGSAIDACRPSYDGKAALWAWEPCDQATLTPTLMDDLDGIAEAFWRIYTKKVHDAFANLFIVDVPIFGPGYHGSKEFQSDGRGSNSPEYLFRGSVSADGNTPYIDIIAIGNIAGSFLNSASDTYFSWHGPKLSSFYAFHGRPYWITATWLTAEEDSGLTHHGTVDSVTATVLTDADMDFSGSIGSGIYNASIQYYLSCNLDEAVANWSWAKISDTGAADGTLTVNSASSMFGPGLGSWTPASADLTTICSEGDEYWIFVEDNFVNFDGYKLEDPVPNLWMPITQEQRGSQYAKYLDEMIDLQAANGDYMLLGYSHYSFFDWSWTNAGPEERNFGFMSVNANLYDGSATIANGEIQDCGDFVTPVAAKLNGLYSEIIGISITHNESGIPIQSGGTIAIQAQ